MGKENANRLKICVIGAGAAGLCAARHLKARPEQFDVELFEQTGDVGGTWQYREQVGNDENGLKIHSSMYKNLKTNIPLNVMSYPDFPCKDSAGAFVGHREVCDYLKDYAQHFQLYDCIKFYHQIVNVKRIQERLWQVTVKDLRTGDGATIIYDGVYLCNGRYAKPNMPDSKRIKNIDKFEGSLIHSHDYRVPEPFDGQRVVVLGAGPSGIDISLEVAAHATTVYLVHMLPNDYVDLPENMVQVKSSIGECSGKDVVMKNGESIKDIDTIIFATGYNYDFEFLDKNCGISVSSEGRVPGVYLHLINVSAPTMAIWAIPMKIIPFPLYHQQVALFTKVLAGDVQLPSAAAMTAHAEEDFQARLKDGVPERHAHKMLDKYIWKYEDEMVKLGGLTPIKPVIKAMFISLHKYRSQNTRGYKDLCFEVLDDSTYAVIQPNETREIVKI